MNKFCKVLIPLILVMSLLLASMPAFAAENAAETEANASSPTAGVIGRVTIKSTTYNGKRQTPKITVYDKAGKKLSSKYYKVTKVSGSGASANGVKWPKNAGTYKVTVKGQNGYTGTKTRNYVIRKAKNPFSIKVGKRSFKRNTQKTQSTTIKVTGVKGKAKITRWASTSPNVYVRGGKLIIRKGCYGSARISVSTLATKNYKYTRKSITITVSK